MSRFTFRIGPTAAASRVSFNGNPVDGVEMISIHTDVRTGMVRAVLGVRVDRADVETRRGQMFTTIGEKRFMLVEEAEETDAEAAANDDAAPAAVTPPTSTAPTADQVQSVREATARSALNTSMDSEAIQQRQHAQTVDGEVGTLRGEAPPEWFDNAITQAQREDREAHEARNARLAAEFGGGPDVARRSSGPLTESYERVRRVLDQAELEGRHTVEEPIVVPASTPTRARNAPRRINPT